MICFSLTCENKHNFDSWFASGSAFDTLQGAGHLSCVVCGSSDVRKSIMAPRLAKGDTVSPKPVADTPLSQPVSKKEAALKELREKIEANSEDVGLSFAKEARAIHEGTAPERAIIGEAKPAEAISLIEDGIGVMPLPFTPTRKTN
jgi:hypothetical protein